MLAAAFMIIWAGQTNPSDDIIEKTIDRYYEFQPAEDHRDEAGELIERLLDESVEVLHDNDRDKLTLREILNRIYTEQYYTEGDKNPAPVNPIKITDYVNTIQRCGIKIVDGSNIAIVNNHHFIRRIIERGNGYSKIFKRHPGYIQADRRVNIHGTTRVCTILRGLLAIKKEDEELARLI
jgi:hypothetical protein